MAVYEKRGYLQDEFRLFSLSDKEMPRVDFHYHEFHKVLLFQTGSAGYVVEGRSYRLQPGDLVLVGQGCVHRPEVEQGTAYKRVVLYVESEFLRRNSRPDCDLEACFAQASGSYGNVVRLNREHRAKMEGIMLELEVVSREKAFGWEIQAHALLMMLMVELTRVTQQRPNTLGQVRDEKILAIIRHINANLTSDINVDTLAETFFISKYHMMRRFHQETGYTVHAYITNKRLLMAHRMIREGQPVTTACFNCGFKDYSAFARAYKKAFAEPPSGRIR